MATMAPIKENDTLNIVFPPYGSSVFEFKVLPSSNDRRTDLVCTNNGSLSYYYVRIEGNEVYYTKSSGATDNPDWHKLAPADAKKWSYPENEEGRNQMRDAILSALRTRDASAGGLGAPPENLGTIGRFSIARRGGDTVFEDTASHARYLSDGIDLYALGANGERTKVTPENLTNVGLGDPTYLDGLLNAVGDRTRLDKEKMESDARTRADQARGRQTTAAQDMYRAAQTVTPPPSVQDFHNGKAHVTQFPPKTTGSAASAAGLPASMAALRPGGGISSTQPFLQVKVDPPGIDIPGAGHVDPATYAQIGGHIYTVTGSGASAALTPVPDDDPNLRAKATLFGEGDQTIKHAVDLRGINDAIQARLREDGNEQPIPGATVTTYSGSPPLRVLAVGDHTQLGPPGNKLANNATYFEYDGRLYEQSGNSVKEIPQSDRNDPRAAQIRAVLKGGDDAVHIAEKIQARSEGESHDGLPGARALTIYPSGQGRMLTTGDPIGGLKADTTYHELDGHYYEQGGDTDHPTYRLLAGAEADRAKMAFAQSDMAWRMRDNRFDPGADGVHTSFIPGMSESVQWKRDGDALYFSDGARLYMQRGGKIYDQNGTPLTDYRLRGAQEIVRGIDADERTTTRTAIRDEMGREVGIYERHGNSGYESVNLQYGLQINGHDYGPGIYTRSPNGIKYFPDGDFSRGQDIAGPGDTHNDFNKVFSRFGSTGRQQQPDYQVLDHGAFTQVRYNGAGDEWARIKIGNTTGNLIHVNDADAHGGSTMAGRNKNQDYFVYRGQNGRPEVVRVERDATGQIHQSGDQRMSPQEREYVLRLNGFAEHGDGRNPRTTGPFAPSGGGDAGYFGEHHVDDTNPWVSARPPAGIGGIRILPPSGGRGLPINFTGVGGNQGGLTPVGFHAGGDPPPIRRGAGDYVADRTGDNGFFGRTDRASWHPDWTGGGRDADARFVQTTFTDGDGDLRGNGRRRYDRTAFGGSAADGAAPDAFILAGYTGNGKGPTVRTANAAAAADQQTDTATPDTRQLPPSTDRISAPKSAPTVGI